MLLSAPLFCHRRARWRFRGPSSGSRTRSCFPAGPWTRRRCRPRLLLGAPSISRSSFPFSFGRSALPTILVRVSSSTFPNCNAIPVVRRAGSAVVSGSSRLTGFCIRPGFVRRRAATVGATASVIGCVATRRSPRRRRRRRCERSSSRIRMTMMIRSRAAPPGSDGVEPFVCRRRPWRRWLLERPARLRCWLVFLRSRSRPRPCAPLAFLRLRLWLRCPPCLPSILDRSVRGPHRLPRLRRRRRRRVRKAARLPLLLSTTHRSCLLQSLRRRCRPPLSTGWFTPSRPGLGLSLLM